MMPENYLEISTSMIDKSLSLVEPSFSLIETIDATVDSVLSCPDLMKAFEIGTVGRPVAFPLSRANNASARVRALGNGTTGSSSW